MPTYIGPALYVNKRLKPYDTISFETLEVLFNGKIIEAVPSIKEDIALINESIFRILTTSKGERVYLREFGCNLKEYVFEPLDGVLLEIINKEVRDALGQWEPRIAVDDVSVEQTGEHSLRVTILYTVLLDKRYSVKAQFIV